MHTIFLEVGVKVCAGVGIGELTNRLQTQKINSITQGIVCLWLEERPSPPSAKSTRIFDIFWECRLTGKAS